MTEEPAPTGGDTMEIDHQQHRRPCGTRAAYHQHLYHGESVDDLCKRANAEHQVALNLRTGASRARKRAYKRLAKKFPDAFQAIMSIEKQKAKKERPGERYHTWYSRARQRAYVQLSRIYSDDFRLILEGEKEIVRREIEAQT
jgi:hypothetical protein